MGRGDGTRKQVERLAEEDTNRGEEMKKREFQVRVLAGVWEEKNR